MFNMFKLSAVIVLHLALTMLTCILNSGSDTTLVAVIHITQIF